MNREQIRDAVLETLGRIAPETDFESIDDDAVLRRLIDLDSMDWPNVIARLHERLGLDIPERDYRRLGTLAGIIDYLAERLRGQSAG